MVKDESQNTEQDNTEQETSPEDKPVTVRELNKILTSYRRQSERDFEKAIQRTQPAKQAEDEETLTLKEQLRRLQEKDKARDAELREERKNKSIRDSLAKHGIDARFISHAHRFIAPMVQFDSDGQLVMTDEYGVNQPIHEALATWAQSEDAKIYRAPRGTAGAGSQSAGAPDPKLPARPQVNADGSQTFSNPNQVLEAIRRAGVGSLIKQ